MPSAAAATATADATTAATSGSLVTDGKTLSSASSASLSRPAWRGGREHDAGTCGAMCGATCGAMCGATSIEGTVEGQQDYVWPRLVLGAVEASQATEADESRARRRRKQSETQRQAERDEGANKARRRGKQSETQAQAEKEADMMPGSESKGRRTNGARGASKGGWHSARGW
eukprot:318419-Chlamydomonas_euryale.AAC.1